MDKDKIVAQQASAHFLKLALSFFCLAKSQYNQQNMVKANTLAFRTLVTLNELTGRRLTMSALAERLDITKQQLTKLVNDLEEKQLVERIHDPKNRRLVYIHITDHGSSMLRELKQSMLESTMDAMAGYTDQELEEMDRCMVKLTELLEKFNKN